MNWFELIPLAILAVFYVGVYFAPQSLKDRVREPLRRWLSPLAYLMFPSLRMEPWLFEPIADGDLPAAQRQHFDRHEATFLVRGFTPLGTLVMRRDAQPSCTRYFLSPDRTMIGEAACYLKTYTAGCMSVLLDGFYIETGNVTVSELPPAEHGLEFCILKTDNTAALIDHHVACVSRTAAARGTHPAPLEPGDLHAIVNHGRQLSLRSLHNQGFLQALPEFLRNKQR